MSYTTAKTTFGNYQKQERNNYFTGRGSVKPFNINNLEIVITANSESYFQKNGTPPYQEEYDHAAIIYNSILGGKDVPPAGDPIGSNPAPNTQHYMIEQSDFDFEEN